MLALLVAHLEKFAAGVDRSVQWAKDGETILDGIEERDSTLEEFQDTLSVYRPGGGPHLVDDREMDAIVRNLLAHLKRIRGPSKS